MSQPIQVPTSPRSSYIHNCRWDWCRLTFPTNALLIDHVIHEHVRIAQPIRRRDLPMLRRAEEGSGESLRWSGVMSGGADNLQSPIASGSNIHASPLTSTDSPRPSKRARTEPQSQPEPSSPTESQSQSQTDLQSQRKANVTQASPKLHALSIPAPPSQSQSSANAQKLSLPPPDPTPSQMLSYSPGRASFAQLSSPDDSSSGSNIAPDSPPASSSFNSQVANAVQALTARLGFGFGGRRSRHAVPARSQRQSQSSPNPNPSSFSSRKREERGVSMQSASPERQISPVLQTSQDRVERELTQEEASDVDMGVNPDAAGTADEIVVNASESGIFNAPTSTSTSNDSQSGLPSQPLGPERQDHGEIEPDTELKWPEDIEIPNSSVLVASESRHSPAPLQSQDEPPQSSAFSAPFVLQTQASCYRALSPSSPLSQTVDRKPHTPQLSSSVNYHLDRTSSQSQSQSEIRLSGEHSFRSGSLKVGRGSEKSMDDKRGLMSQSSSNGASASGNMNDSQEHVEVGANADADQNVEADALISQGIAQSQTQSQESQGSASGFKHHSLQLQTQAPYQSQSFSQSTSETNVN